MLVWHFCSYWGLFLRAPHVAVGSWSVHEVAAIRWSVINLPKMQITFCHGAVLTQPVLKTQRKVQSFANVVQCFDVLFSALRATNHSSLARWADLSCQNARVIPGFGQKGKELQYECIMYSHSNAWDEYHQSLKFWGNFLYSSLKCYCCFRLREFPQATTSYIFVCFLVQHLFINKKFCLQVIDIQFQKQSTEFLYFFSKMRQFSVKYLSARVKPFSVLILNVSSSDFSFSLQSEPKVNLSLEVALSQFSSFALLRIHSCHLNFAPEAGKSLCWHHVTCLIAWEWKKNQNNPVVNHIQLENYSNQGENWEKNYVSIVNFI